jgi:RsiW-degrading membrane proteinase PrsW (M82 family)
MELIYAIIIGITPCVLWLLLYLRQDVHPESNKKILEIFFWGALAVIPIVYTERALGSFFPTVQSLNQNIFLLLGYYVLVIGLVEELFKYLVVRFRVLNTSHFDEPIDAMLYLIIASLGVAAAENLFVILKTTPMNAAIGISVIRLLTAIFLHTLAAAITGYFLAASMNRKGIKKYSIFAIGLLIASVLHGLYDVSIVKLETAQNIFIFLIPIAIIFVMGLLVYLFFLKVKNMPRACKL